MDGRLTMAYWKGERFWLGKLLDHPQAVTRGEQPVPRHVEIDNALARHIKQYLVLKS